MMSKNIIAIAAIAASLFTAAAYATTCADGTQSNSTGRGTCSHHGGENWRPAARQALYTASYNEGWQLAGRQTLRTQGTFGDKSGVVTI